MDCKQNFEGNIFQTMNTVFSLVALKNLFKKVQTMSFFTIGKYYHFEFNEKNVNNTGN